MTGMLGLTAGGGAATWSSDKFIATSNTQVARLTIDFASHVLAKGGGDQDIELTNSMILGADAAVLGILAPGSAGGELLVLGEGTCAAGKVTFAPKNTSPGDTGADYAGTASLFIVVLNPGTAA